MSISKADRQLVINRAKECCEYCRLPANAGTVEFHIDHIIPRKHDGTDTIDNLCFACFHCNLYKSHDLTGFDPETGEISRLYHPRNQVWGEHFKIVTESLVTGKSSEGRTTVNVLKMNLEERVESRQVLADIDEYPCEDA